MSLLFPAAKSALVGQHYILPVKSTTAQGWSDGLNAATCKYSTSENIFKKEYALTISNLLISNK
jgi:hypothetical protein